MVKITAIIPARYHSTRFEGKPLAPILGKPMIQRVYEGVSQSSLIDEIIVATDDRRILEVVRSFGGRGMMTSPDHLTGTDRVAEVARKLRSEIIVNVQGDEPLIKGSIIDAAVRPFLTDGSLLMSTLMTGIEKAEDWRNPHNVKVVVDRRGFALYFSRSPIPFQRLTHPSGRGAIMPKGFFKHIGVYGFRRRFLLRFSKMKPTPLERFESLEQLRALENGHPIKVVPVDYAPVSVDTPDDLQRVVRVLSKPSQ
jgi:3-deoxy-manno-octulosonate cytidylyltransferase (CMP-KDO synthetase)